MILSILLIIVIIALMFYSFTKFQKIIHARKEQAELFGEKKVRNQNLSNQLSAIAQTAYNFVERIPVLRSIQSKLRKKLEILAIYDEFSLRREVMKIFFAISAMILIISLIGIIIRPSIAFVFWILVGVLMLSGTLIDFFIYRVEFKLFKQLKDYNNRVRFYFQSTKMVDESFFEAIHDAGNEMKIHAERINQIINSVDTEKELAAYEEVAPTRYLRVIAGLAVLVKERGDKIVDGKSAFLNGLTAINKELSNEILYRSRLSYVMKNLPTLAVVPIFAALPLKNWSINSFPVTQEFYDSKIGLFTEILVYAVSIICYLTLRKMREVSESNKELVIKKNKWERWVLEKVKGAKLICRAFTPKKYSRKYNASEQLIKDANESITIYELTLRKIISAILVFILIVGVFGYTHIREKSIVLEGSSYSFSLYTEEFQQQESLVMMEQTEYDKELINDLSNTKVFPTREELLLSIADHLKLEATDEEVLKTYDRVMDKYIKYSNAYIKWWEILIAVLIAYIAYQIPKFVLIYKKKARLKLMEDEVYQLLMIISILKDFEGISVANILEWLRRFSIAFRRSLDIAIEEFDSGPEEALEKLGETNTFEAFQQIVERLKLTLLRLSIQEAFNDIDIEREYYLDERIDKQAREIDSKENWGRYLGLGPTGLLIFLYLIFPLLYIAVTGSSDSLDLLS